jgi:hypothetical protein
VVSVFLVNEYGWKVGDKIPLQTERVRTEKRAPGF